MKTTKLPIAFFLLLSLIIARSASSQHTIIKGNIQKSTSDTVSFWGYLKDCEKIRNLQPLAYTMLDAKGNFVFNLSLSAGTPFYIKNGGHLLMYNAFISPGDSIVLGFDENKLTMDGKGSDKLEFSAEFADTFFVKLPLGTEYKEAYKNLDLPTYVTYLDNRRQQELQFLTNFFKNKPQDPDFEKYEKFEINYKYATDKLEYLWKHNYSLRINGAIHPDPSYFQFPKDIPVEDSAAFISPRYFDFLEEYISSVEDYWLESHSLEERKRLYKVQLTSKYHMTDSLLQGKFNDIVKAKLLVSQIEHLPSNPAEVARVKFEIDSLRTLLHHSTFCNCLDSIVQQECEKAFSLPGKPAPNFELKSLSDSIVRLSDFKDKVVLLDFWATNCNPCIKEIPYANALQDRFKGKDFIMIPICCSSSIDEWHKLVKTYNWNGIHLFNDDAKKLMQTYNINGFPHYILIDKQGIVYLADAARPSDPDIDKQILKLLGAEVK